MDCVYGMAITQTISEKVEKLYKSEAFCAAEINLGYLQYLEMVRDL